MPQDTYHICFCRIKNLVFLFIFAISFLGNAQTEIKENKVLNDPEKEEWIDCACSYSRLKFKGLKLSIIKEGEALNKFKLFTIFGSDINTQKRSHIL